MTVTGQAGGGRAGAVAADAATWPSLPQPPGGDGSSNKLEELESIWTERTCGGRQGSAPEGPLGLPLRESSRRETAPFSGEDLCQDCQGPTA